MLSRRITYGMVLAAAVLFQICFTGYFSHFILVLVLCFPLLSLLLSLPGILGVSVSVTHRTATVERGGTGQWDIRLDNRTHLPLARLVLALEMENLLTRETHTAKRTLTGVSSGRTLHETADTAHCGQLSCSIRRVRVCDLLGLFNLPLKLQSSAGMLAIPRRIDPFPLPELAGDARSNAGVRPRPGGGPGEDYDLRPYRPGDPMHSVHWKLSSKLDELVVRETLEPHRAVLVLTYDHMGPPDRLDAVLERLCAASRSLLDQEQPHHIQWLEPASGTRRSTAVSTERELLDLIARSLCTYAPRDGKSILDLPIRVEGQDGPIRHLHITATDADPEKGGAG